MSHVITKPITPRRLPQVPGLLLAAAVICSGGFGQALALVRIPTPPVDQSVSVGASVTHLVSATGVAPLSYQWRFKNVEIAGAVRRTLVVTNVQMTNAGGYSVVVTDPSGSVTSRVATLDVDPTFTVITASPIAMDVGPSVGAAWGDYDNDGFPDLLVGNIGGTDFLYHNRGDGSFERALTNVIGGLRLGSGAWGDYDNDGLLDLYTTSGRDLGVNLYHNEGNGTFLRLTNAAVVGAILTNHAASGSMAWGDYDNDGFVDAFVANGAFSGDLQNFLFHNQGNGSFTRITAGSVVNDLRNSWSGTWADYDDDGRLDLFVTNADGESNQLFHNAGLGAFSRLTGAQVGSLVEDGVHSRGSTWGDYNNDGHLDLFVSGTTSFLYRNNGMGTFQRITTGDIVTDVPAIESLGCKWVDYDNDGYLDLIAIDVGGNNLFYHNNGDETFTRAHLRVVGNFNCSGGRSRDFGWPLRRPGGDASRGESKTGRFS